MEKIIDKQGFIHIFKWKVNLIDAFAILFILMLVPAFFAGWKLMTLKPAIVIPPSTTPPPTHYTIPMHCPICCKDISDEIQIPLGERPKRFYKLICPNCGNFVKTWIK